MRLSDFKTKPTRIRSDLQITGPNGATTGDVEMSIDSTVITPTKSKTYTDKIKCYTNAVTTAVAEIGGLQGKTQKITVKTAGTKNCYWLPWGEGKVYIGALGGDHDYFFTYTINGCGVFFGGTANAPIVAHANMKSDRLDTIAMKGGDRVAERMKELEEQGVKFKPELVTDINKQVASDQSIAYDQFYGNLGAALIDDDQLSGAKIEVVTPEQYLIRANAGFGAVFGVKDKNNAWSFYGNWGGQTKQIW
ncbi:MAG: hypothetical protein AAFN27_18065 [Pseudomonadota bacterium]